MTPTLVQIDGLFWPASDVRARPVLVEAVKRDVPRFLRRVYGRDCVVQAGGNVGVWPLDLADHFRTVITVEPDPANFECLKRNLEARDSRKRVLRSQAAFGARADTCAPVVVEADNCGAHRVALGTGEIPVVTIDFMVTRFGDRCDGIWLDVEGCELLALKGAEETIKRHSPVICLEDKNHHRAFGIADGELDAWLKAHGYAEADRWANDRLFKRNA